MASSTGSAEPEPFDPDALVARFRERAEAVRNRPLPPVEGAMRGEFIRQAQVDYTDFAIIGDATADLDGGILTLRIDLRPQS